MRNVFLAFVVLASFLGGLGLNVLADEAKMSSAVTKEKVDKSVERLIGNLIRARLKRFHYTKKKLDDSLSEKAFDEFIKRFDFGRQFFLASDVKTLKKYRYRLDDQMISGEHELLNKTVSLYNKRINELNNHRKKVFKKSFLRWLLSSLILLL